MRLGLQGEWEDERWVSLPGMKKRMARCQLAVALPRRAATRLGADRSRRQRARRPGEGCRRTVSLAIGCRRRAADGSGGRTKVHQPRAAGPERPQVKEVSQPCPYRTPPRPTTPSRPGGHHLGREIGHRRRVVPTGAARGRTKKRTAPPLPPAHVRAAGGQGEAPPKAATAESALGVGAAQPTAGPGRLASGAPPPHVPPRRPPPLTAPAVTATADAGR